MYLRRNVSSHLSWSLLNNNPNDVILTLSLPVSIVAFLTTPSTYLPTSSIFVSSRALNNVDLGATIKGLTLSAGFQCHNSPLSSPVLNKYTL